VIRREHYCNKLRERGYTFDRQGDRVMLYKRPGNPDFVTVPRRDLIGDDYVRSALLRAGFDSKDVENFIATHQAQGR
jgi:hypothetical protein